MKRTPVSRSPELFPRELQPWLQNTLLFDSSCSQNARVWFLDRDTGFYLKTAPAGSLLSEARQAQYFHEKGLGPEVLAYLPQEQDWLLTARVPGEDCTHRQYLEDPQRLAVLLGELLRKLHDTPAPDCPLQNHSRQYLDTVYKNYEAGLFDNSGKYHSSGSPEEAIAIIREFAPHLRTDTLLHGDFCLPNILLDNWLFSGFIDLGQGGIGDRHVDLYWGAWSLRFNLGTDAWCGSFLDAYGRDRIEPELLRAIGAFEVFG